MTARASWLPWLGLGALWTAAFVTACHLLQLPLLQASQQLSGWAGLFSASRAELSNSLYSRADVYFHRGVTDIEQKALPGLLGRWLATIAPTEHRHAADASSLETMPWLRWATELDPGNVTAWLDAAYAADYVNNPALSLQILAEALRHNPRDDRIFAQRGLLLLRQHRYAQAADDLDRALRLVVERKAPDAALALLRQDVLASLKNKTLCEEMLGHRDLALAHLRQCVELEPGRVATRSWLAAVEAGNDLRADAEQRLAGLLRETRSADPDERRAPPPP
jgi:tetratricopeptide (TPR) repeat protein